MTKLITATELSAQLNKGLVVFDCRFRLNDADWGRAAYRQGHIPGAHYLDLNRDLSSPVHPHGGRHPLPDWQQLASTLAQAGVTRHSSIVLYDDSRFAFAARAWWLLQQLGCSNLALLDGGYQAWLDSGGAQDRRTPLRAGPTSVKTPLAPAGQDPSATGHHGWINREQLLAAPNHYTLIDAREAARFSGKEEPIDPVAGHIPGALNSPWQGFTRDDGFCKTLDEQRQQWDKLGIAASNKPLVVYCGSGVTACVNLLSLQLCGYPAQLYPGSWSDWCSYPGHPKAP